MTKLPETIPHSRQRLINACFGRANDRPPVWIMRQAGRYLPEYRELKKQYDFLTLAKTPDLATEVTLQPLRRFALDAAILFSDILIIPEAMGQPYHFRDQGGIDMDYLLENETQIQQLTPAAIPENLAYVGKAMSQVRTEIGEEMALLGFGGAPWTLATYMIEGGSTRDYTRLKSLFMENPKLFHLLMEKISEALIALFKMKIENGADAIQIFDSWASLAPGMDYWECSLRWIHQIIQALPPDFPVILYSKGMAHHYPKLLQCGAQVLGIDQSVDLPGFCEWIPDNVCVQGNLDPVLMTCDPAIVREQTRRFLEKMNNRPGHILNLGHGITPQARIESVEAFVDVATSPRVPS